jgi:hypothetical protein
MSITFKFILDQRRPKADKTCPVRLRVYNNNEYKGLTLGIKIKLGDWDDVNKVVLPSNTDFENYNIQILSKKSKVQKLILLAELSEDTYVSLTEIIAALPNETIQTKTPIATFHFLNMGRTLLRLSLVNQKSFLSHLLKKRGDQLAPSL